MIQPLSLLAKQNNWHGDHPLLLMYFQQLVEQRAYAAGGGNLVAPAQRMADFCNQKLSAIVTCLQLFARCK